MSVYYNEFEPFAAQWLRELMADGLIAQGEVDERSILDVRPADLRGYDQCHFFAGIGGWSYALRLAGWPDDRPVWTGSCPCQPLSSAGKQKGHADERHIWPAFYELIAECRPSTVFGEQVASKDGREWLAGVRADLEDARYAVGAADLCAAGVGAPHIRQRLFWVADAQRWAAERHGHEVAGAASSHQGRKEERQRLRPDAGHGGVTDCGTGERVAQSPDARPPRAGGKPQPKSALIQPGNGSGKEGTASRVAHADEGQRGRLADGKGRQHYGAPTGRQQGDGIPQSGGADSRLADADGGHPGAEREQRSGEQRQQPQDGGTGERVADAEGTKHPHNATTDRPGKGAQVEPRGGGLLSGGLDGRMGDADDTGSQGRGQHFGQHADQQPPWSASDLIPCADGKWRRVPANEAGEPEPGLFPLAHGVSNRVGTLRGAGNAITPQVAAAFIDAFASSCS
jgi:DNA (cytosine-5)-methyltransferase 1